jgi:putative oxidoreductase
VKTAFLLGRLLFGGFFLYNGINHFKEAKAHSDYAAQKGIPAPNLAVGATGVALLIGGASVLTGIKPKLGTLAILGFLLGVSPLMHDFWRDEDPEQRMNQMINFSKNLALAGAALALMAVEEPWPVSVPIAQPGTVERVKRAAQRFAA